MSGEREKWRVGRSVGRTLYVGDRLIGVVDTPDLAEQIVTAVNATAHLWDLSPDDLTVTTFWPPDALANESARGVEIVHVPTGRAVRRINLRSQLANKAAAIRELRSLLVETLGRPQ